MLIISPRQMQAFEQTMRKTQVDGLLEQLQAELPEHLHAVGLPAARVLVADGLERAAGHGLTSLAAGSVFVKLLFVLGERFDSDPTLPCGAVLEEKGLDEPVRVKRLLDSLALHARSLAGPEER